MPRIETPGTYIASVTDVAVGQTPNTGSPYIELTFETEDGQHAYRSLFVTEKAFEYTDKTLKSAFDFDGGYDPVDRLKAQIVGKKCRIVMEQETGDDGKERVVVRWINKVRDTTPVKDQANLLRSLTAKSAARGGTATPRAFAGEKKTAAVSNEATEEVPF